MKLGTLRHSSYGMHLETCHCHSSRELLAIGVGFSKGVLCDSHQRWGRQDALKSATATTHAQPFLACSGLLNQSNDQKEIESQKNIKIPTLCHYLQTPRWKSPIRLLMLIKMAWNVHHKGSMWESHGCIQLVDPKYHRTEVKIRILCLIDGDSHNTNVLCQIYYARESFKG